MLALDQLEKEVRDVKLTHDLSLLFFHLQEEKDAVQDLVELGPAQLILRLIAAKDGQDGREDVVDRRAGKPTLCFTVDAHQAECEVDYC